MIHIRYAQVRKRACRPEVKMTDKNERSVLELQLRPVWDEIERARTECRAFLQKLGSSDEIQDSVCMITSELIENAIKYGHFSSAANEFSFKIEAGPDGMLLQSKSPLPSAGIADNLKRLDSIIQWIRGFQSPFEAYLERLKLVAAQPLEDNESGLGLTRIAYEGEAILDFYIDQGDILYVSALQPNLEKQRMVSI